MHLTLYCLSVGCGPTISAIPNHVYRSLESALAAKTRAERDLKTYTNLVSHPQSRAHIGIILSFICATQDWTIIRPGGLRNGAPSGKAILTEHPMASGVIDRVDAADLIIRVLGSPGHCTRRELTAIDPSADPEGAEEYHSFQLD